jgi:transcriptional regulator of acetoin/glycerol metabolism
VLASSANGSVNEKEFANEREILYKLFFDMKKDVNELKKMFYDIIKNPSVEKRHYQNDNLLPQYQSETSTALIQPPKAVVLNNSNNGIQQHEEVDESLSIVDKEKELIIKALKKHRGKRKDASLDLGISERTLYRKLKEYDINE